MSQSNSNASELFKPIADMNGPSPSVMVHSKRQLEKFQGKSGQPQSTMNANALGVNAGEGNALRNNQVTYSFGQQPFSNMQMSQRAGGNESSAHNSILNVAVASSGAGSAQRTKRTGQLLGPLSNQQEKNVTSQVPSMGSEREQTSKDKKSVSMASVMGQFDQPATANPNQVPNIFAQSIQNSQTASATRKKGGWQGNPALHSLTQTEQNFSETASKVNEIEQAVTAGLKMTQDRQSQHSLEAEKMGLRRSQEGFQTAEEKPNAKKPKDERKKNGSRIEQLAEKALSLVGNMADKITDSKVPDTIREQLIKQGFRPSSKQDGQFEYESDTIEVYEMISNEFDYEEVRKLPEFGIKQYKDCIYRGQLNPVTRQREGLGVLVYQNGRVYEGEWLKNRRHGRGYEVFANGNFYHGTHENGKANGKGVYQWKHGEVYDGEWQQGIKHGYGVWKGTNGESYIGQWFNSKAQGYGVHVFANGDKYEGEWFQCLRHGNGSDFFANGDCYVGQYGHGKPEGFGQYKWKNGSSYTGQFLNGLKHGHGKWKKKQADELGQTLCNQYEGMYFNDKKHGYGVFEWESGNRYTGNYLEDERHGYGVMKWTDESQYMGMWNEGIQHGVGVMVFPDGIKRAGIFEENVFKESLKTRDQIDPYRDQLSQDCIDILEKIVAEREQSKANLFGPLNKSKAELLQREMTNTDLNIGLDSPTNATNQRQLAADGTEEKSLQLTNKQQSIGEQASIKASGEQGSTAAIGTQTRGSLGAREMASQGASGQNLRMMRKADKEDQNQTMQKGNPMRSSAAIASLSLRKSKASQGSRQKSILPSKATSRLSSQKRLEKSVQRPNLGRTIEVQTDLSMVTMEQYSQGYNSKAFMNKTHDYKTKSIQGADTLSAGGSPAIKYQNDLNQSDRDFSNVLSKPAFQDIKIQQDILGGDNPNQDTESEWNRNNSSMMVRQPGPFEGTIGSSRGQTTVGGLDIKKKLFSQSKKKKSSVGVERRKRSKERNQNTIQYQSHRLQGLLGQLAPRNLLSVPRDSKFTQPDRSLIQNRQGQRNERSLPRTNRNQNDHAFTSLPDPANLGDFVVPGAQGISKGPKQINRHNVMGLINESKRPPQKMFQSQYGGQRFGKGVFGLPERRPQQQALPDSIFNQSMMQTSGNVSPLSSPRNAFQGQAGSDPSTLGFQGAFPNINNAKMPSTRTVYQVLPTHQKILQDTPIAHSKLNMQYPVQNYGVRQYLNGQLSVQQESVREDILTPSPQLDRSSKASDMLFNRTSAQNFQFKPIAIHGSDMSLTHTNGSQIAVEPMFGQSYGRGVQRDIQQQFNSRKPSKNTYENSSIADVPKDIFAGDTKIDFRGKTSTSSQRTLRYNDFELVQKQAQNDPVYAVDLDDANDKESEKPTSQDHQDKDQAVQYPDFNLQRLYESKQDPQTIPRDHGKNAPLASTRSNQAPFQQHQSQHSPQQELNQKKVLPKMSVNQSINQQRKNSNDRKHLNSNDTQLASHTIALNASQEHTLMHSQRGSGYMLENGQRRNAGQLVHRSQPPATIPTSKISVKHGISLLHSPLEIIHQVGSRKKFKYASPTTVFAGQSPNSGAAKLVERKIKRRDGSDSNSRTRFNFIGPYAQNLKKPKLYEARGMQKIALKNHLSSQQQNQMAAAGGASRYGQQQPVNSSEIFSKNRGSFGDGESIVDPADRHLERFNSHNHGITGGNYVIKHQSLQAEPRFNQNSSLPQMRTHKAQPVKNYEGSSLKRVWVPYNKKLKLKGMQQQMNNQSRSVLPQQNYPIIGRNHQHSLANSNPLLNSQ